MDHADAIRLEALTMSASFVRSAAKADPEFGHLLKACGQKTRPTGQVEQVRLRDPNPSVLSKMLAKCAAHERESGIGRAGTAWLLVNRANSGHINGTHGTRMIRISNDFNVQFEWWRPNGKDVKPKDPKFCRLVIAGAFGDVERAIAEVERLMDQSPIEPKNVVRPFAACVQKLAKNHYEAIQRRNTAEAEHSDEEAVDEAFGVENENIESPLPKVNGQLAEALAANLEEISDDPDSTSLSLSSSSADTPMPSFESPEAPVEDLQHKQHKAQAQELCIQGANVLRTLLLENEMLRKENRQLKGLLARRH